MIIGSILNYPFQMMLLQVRVECQKQKTRSLDAAAARNENEIVGANWVEHNVPLSKLHNKRELNHKHNKSRIYVHDNLWGN